MDNNENQNVQPVQEQPIQQPVQSPVIDQQETIEFEPVKQEGNEIKKEKKSKGPIIIIILLVLMVLGLAGYVVWDHFNVKEPEKPKEEKITVTESEAKEYLEYVPFSPEYDLDETGLKNDEDYGPNAYIGRDITTNQMNEELLLAMAYNKIMVKSSTPEKVEADFCGEAKTCQGDGYTTIEDMDKQVKKMYDLNNIVSTKFPYPGGEVQKTKKYWTLFMGKGNLYSIDKISEMVDYKLDKDNNLIIREKAAFAIIDKVNAETVDTKSIDLYAYSVKTEKIANGQDPKALFEENEDKLSTFIHTFKLDENNNFYYYSTKVQ